MPKGYSLFIVPDKDMRTKEGIFIWKGLAYGVLGGCMEYETVHKQYGNHEVNISRKQPYRTLTRQEAKAEGLALPVKSRKT